ncbi:MAG: site-2 protease family protein [Clostridia bacterium]|nr:site-2 protease family protein [Clostridia bacterium]
MRSFIIQLLLSLPIVLLSLSLHEMAHGYVADKLGDPTAKNLGRLTLNPIKHLDPIGFICMLLFGFGWAKAVPINTRYFKKPRRDMAISAAAGPISNVILAFIFAILLKIFYLLLPSLPLNNSELIFIIYLFLTLGIRLNITLAVFNLLPVPPLDGSRILYVFLPPKYYFGVMKYERYISLGIMLLLLLGVLDPVLNFVSGGIMNLIFLVLGI